MNYLEEKLEKYNENGDIADIIYSTGFLTQANIDNPQIIIWKDPYNHILITSKEEFDSWSISSNDGTKKKEVVKLFCINDKQKAQLLSSIMLSDKSYKEKMESIISLVSKKESNNIETNGIKYLKRLLQNYKQFDVEIYISVSYLAEVEREKDNPEIVIWKDDFENRVNITSKEEYNCVVKSIKKRCKKYGLSLEAYLPDVLFEVKGKEKVDDTINSMLGYRKYNVKLENLIDVLEEGPKLRLK